MNKIIILYFIGLEKIKELPKILEDKLLVEDSSAHYLWTEASELLKRHRVADKIASNRTTRYIVIKIAKKLLPIIIFF